jgi:hypothetical protein
MDSAMKLFTREAYGLSNMPAEIAPVPELAHPPDELAPRKDRDPRYASQGINLHRDAPGFGNQFGGSGEAG